MTHYVFATPEEAERAFYDAFQNADLHAMMNIWADREFIECIHPLCDRARGRTAVADSWQEIFSGGLQIQLELSEVHRTQDALLAVHIVYEHLSVPVRDTHYPPVIATNIYQLIDGGWRMVLHHASPTPAEEQHDNDEFMPEDGNIQRLH